MFNYKKSFMGTKKETNEVIRMQTIVIGLLAGIIFALIAALLLKWQNHSYEVVAIAVSGEDKKVYNIAPISSNVNAREIIALSRAEEFVKSYHSISPIELEMQLQWGEQGFIRSFASTKVWNNFLQYVGGSQWKEIQASGYKKVTHILNSEVIQNTKDRIKVEFEVITFDNNDYELSRSKGTAILVFGFVKQLPAYIAEQSWNKSGIYFDSYEYTGG